MKILIACEESQIVCKAFRERGHEAYSCDVLSTSGDHPEWHIRRDVRKIFDPSFCNIVWDMIIAFPPCTDLSVSGARWFKDKDQKPAIDFFMLFANHSCEKIAIENPIGIMSTHYRKPDQIIQPWQFGHGETKATCLWLKGLPLLKPENIVEGREGKVWRMAPGPERAKNRSRTYEGIGKAMANQWNF